MNSLSRTMGQWCLVVLWAALKLCPRRSVSGSEGNPNLPVVEKC